MDRVRPPAVAGMFYEEDPGRLEAAVRKYVATAEQVDIDFALRILIVPHAGHVYSGPVAATGYGLVERGAPWHRIVLIGPSHFVRFAGLALPGADALETPLGRVAVDREAVATLLAGDLITDLPEVHRREHCLEVQLPFLQVVAPDVPVVALLTGDVDYREAAAAVSPLLDEATLLLISSDLSHYHDSARARRLDARTADVIADLQPELMDWESACGRTAIQTGLTIAAQNGYQVRVLDLRNSGDTAGPPDRVVGYGTFAIG
jgi:AmmeMemoRadiSam system protein B